MAGSAFNGFPFLLSPFWGFAEPSFILFLLLSIKVLAGSMFAFFSYLTVCYFFVGGGSSTFFVALEFFLSNGLEVNFESSLEFCIFSGISGRTGSMNFLNLGSLFFSATYLWKSLFF